MLRLRFIGQDRSCGFRTGKKYFVNIKKCDCHNWYWVNELFGKSCPYKTIDTLKQNWEIDSFKMNQIMKL